MPCVDRDTQGECYMIVEAEIGQMQLQAKEGQGVTARVPSWARRTNDQR